MTVLAIIRRRATGLLMSLALGLLLAGCSTSGHSATVSTTHKAPPTTASTTATTRTLATSSPEPAVRCTDLSLAKGSFIGGGMEESAVLLTLTNRGPDRCELSGYPKVVLLTATGRGLQFTYTRERNQFMTSGPPQRVYLSPGGRAYVLLVTYNCEVGRGVGATKIRLRPPGTTEWLSVSRESAYSGYCPQFAPGQSMAVSPVEATVAGTLPS